MAWLQFYSSSLDRPHQEDGYLNQELENMNVPFRYLGHSRQQAQSPGRKVPGRQCPVRRPVMGEGSGDHGGLDYVEPFYSWGNVWLLLMISSKKVPQWDLNFLKITFLPCRDKMVGRAEVGNGK